MSEKVTMQMLSEALADRNGLTKKYSENFLKVFFDTLTEVLTAEGVVRIKGFGTFKLVEVGERESVSVSTGERFLIPGYKKVGFAPDDSFNAFISGKNNVEADDQNVFDEVNTDDSARGDEAVNLPESADEEAKAVVPDEAGSETNDEVIICQLDVLLEENVETPEDVERKSDEFSGIDLLISTPESIEGVKEDLWRAKNTMLTLHAKAEQAIKAAKDAQREVLRLERLVDHLENNKGVALVKCEDEADVTPVVSEISEEENKAATVVCETAVPMVDESVDVIPDSEDEREEEYDVKSNTRRNIAVVLIVLAVLALIGWGVYYFMFGSSDDGSSDVLEVVEKNDVTESLNVYDTIATDTLLVEDSLVNVVDNELVQDSVPQPYEENVGVQDNGGVTKAEDETDTKTAVVNNDAEISDTKSAPVAEQVNDTNKPETPVEPIPKTYIMKVGDTLTKLARRYYGSPSYVVEIINANNFSDPNNVPVGAVVVLPEIPQP